MPSLSRRSSSQLAASQQWLLLHLHARRYSSLVICWPAFVSQSALATAGFHLSREGTALCHAASAASGQGCELSLDLSLLPAGSDATPPVQETSLSQPFYGSSSYQAPASQPSYSSHQAAASSQALPYNLYPAATQASYSGGYAPQSAYQQAPQAQAPTQQQGFAGYAQQAQQAAQNTQYAMPAAVSEPAKPAPAAPAAPEPNQVREAHQVAYGFLVRVVQVGYSLLV